MTDHPDHDSVYERNRRATARSDFYRWLLVRYGAIELLELMDAEDKISLRQIFIPMRVDLEDCSDDAMPGSEKAKDEEEPGQLLWDLLVEQRFVAISGRPGSGKTTTVKALINELCGEQSSQLRQQLGGEIGIAPIPIILRDIPTLKQIKTLDQLLETWWQKQFEEAADKNHQLSHQRLRYSFNSTQENFPQLILFDGIDECGGQKVRSQVLTIAAEAALRGHRVLLTGCPAGFRDLQLDQDQVKQLNDYINTSLLSISMNRSTND